MAKKVVVWVPVLAIALVAGTAALFRYSAYADLSGLPGEPADLRIPMPNADTQSFTNLLREKEITEAINDRSLNEAFHNVLTKKASSAEVVLAYSGARRLMPILRRAGDTDREGFEQPWQDGYFHRDDLVDRCMLLIEVGIVQAEHDTGDSKFTEAVSILLDCMRHAQRLAKHPTVSAFVGGQLEEVRCLNELSTLIRRNVLSTTDLTRIRSLGAKTYQAPSLRDAWGGEIILARKELARLASQSDTDHRDGTAALKLGALRARERQLALVWSGRYQRLPQDSLEWRRSFMVMSELERDLPPEWMSSVIGDTTYSQDSDIRSIYTESALLPVQLAAIRTALELAARGAELDRMGGTADDWRSYDADAASCGFRVQKSPVELRLVGQRLKVRQVTVPSVHHVVVSEPWIISVGLGGGK